MTKAWLVEWPLNDNMPTRWWNPDTGWMLDANKAQWFVRQQDAEICIKTSLFDGWAKPTEHIFVPSKDGAASMLHAKDIAFIISSEIRSDIEPRDASKAADEILFFLYGGGHYATTVPNGDRADG